MSTRGAEFRKCDFQIHSPRDAGWEGGRPEDGLSGDASDEEIDQCRAAFCKQFLLHCISQGLEAIAMTDHHEGIYCYPMIQAAKALEAETPGLSFWVFPGMELTCKDACQALVIFDADLPVSLFEKARAKLGLPSDTKPKTAKGIQVELLHFNIEELQELLDTDSELRDRFIIFPHVKPGGHKTVLRSGFHKRFKDMPYVGGYMDRCYPADLQDGDRRILEGAIPAWTSERRGVFSCSDSRYADFRLIGKHATWIKLASPTAESLRQAMLAPDSRIRYEEPALPKAVIRSVTVNGSKYLKDGIYNFNQQLNSIIGGRGAGKSTLLEYIRFALGRSALDESDSTSASLGRLSELLISTLDKSNGSIAVEVLLNGARVTATRNIATHGVISIATDESSTPTSPNEVLSLIETQHYRQSELSELARDDAADRLLALLTGEASSAIQKSENELKNNGQQLVDSLNRAVRLSAAKFSKAHAQTKKSLVEAQIESLTKQLAPAEQSTDTAISRHDDFSKQQHCLDAVSNELLSAKKQIESVLANFEKAVSAAIKNQPIFKTPIEIDSLVEHLKVGVNQDGESPTAIETMAKPLFDWFDTSIKLAEDTQLAWKQPFDAHQIDYIEERKGLSDKISVVESIERLKTELQETSNSLLKATQDEESFSESDSQLAKHRQERMKLQLDLKNTIEKQISSIEILSEGLARGRLAATPKLEEVENALRSILALPNIREGRIDALVTQLRKAPSISDFWKEIQDEFLAILKWKEGSPTEKGQPPETPILQAALENNFMDKLRERIDSIGVQTVLQATLTPRAEVFQVRNNSEIEFRKASQGEQAATLLNILMNQSGGPLIIDQPEEDLDNRIINEIIKTITKTKDARQLIFATHNANIAVNGDSENVIEMVLGQQCAVGAIDEEEVRNAITKTMEGGKDAFELRRKKYNF